MKRLLLGSTVLLVTACSGERDDYEELAELGGETPEEHDPANYVPDLEETGLEELSISELQQLANPITPPSNQLSQEEMKEDAVTLMRLFRYGYGPMEYYGGEDVFLEHHNELIDWIEEAETDISARNFMNRVKETYAFVTDQHLFLGSGVPFEREEGFYYIEDVYVNQANDEWFLEDAQILSINGDDPDEWIVPHISEEGKLEHIIGRSTAADDSWQVETEDETLDVTAVRPLGTASPSADILDVSMTEGEIPIIRLGSMTVFDDDGVTYDDMLETVQTVEEADAAIIDLRGNRGGLGIFVTRWVHDLTGSPPTESTEVGLKTNTNHILLSNMRDIYEEEGMEVVTFYDHIEPEMFQGFDVSEVPVEPEIEVTSFDDEWEEAEVPIAEEPKLNTPLYILVDEETASASEYMVMSLQPFEDAHIIGVPTMGALISDAGSSVQLPNSHMPVQMPAFFLWNPHAYGREGYGLEPDIWMAPSDALDHVSAWVDRVHASDTP
ncbi:S41 family peptidase [Alkalicoccus luteus]|uniref:S41 family peptidase n=1 Tax=Alkalicoccus luteus TaxID=1237094 RepID=UPI004033220B